MSDMFPTFRKLSFSASNSFSESLAVRSSLWALAITSVFLPLMVLFEEAMALICALLMTIGVVGLLLLIGSPVSPRDAVLRGLKVTGVPVALLVLLAAGVATSAEPLGGAFILLAAGMCALSGVLGALVIFWVRKSPSGGK